MSVNDLAKQFMDDENLQLEDRYATHFKKLDPKSWHYAFADGYEDGQIDCAEKIEKLSRTAWHPVSKPPTEEDGDEIYRVLIQRADGAIGLRGVSKVDNPNDSFLPRNQRVVRWARISDVVLFPILEERD